MGPGRSERQGSQEPEVPSGIEQTGTNSPNRNHTEISGQARSRTERKLSLSSRRMIRCLRERGGEATLIRLAADVAIRKYGTTPTPGRIQKVYSSLYDDHLQQLLDAGVVSYCDEVGTVSLQ